MDLLLVRHGQTDWNPLQKVMGRGAIGLNATGVEQAKNLQRWLKNIPIDAVYSSTMPRALQTAEIILEGRYIHTALYLNKIKYTCAICRGLNGDHARFAIGREGCVIGHIQ